MEAGGLAGLVQQQTAVEVGAALMALTMETMVVLSVVCPGKGTHQALLEVGELEAVVVLVQLGGMAQVQQVAMVAQAQHHQLLDQA
jgi:hypothetical protein